MKDVLQTKRKDGRQAGKADVQYTTSRPTVRQAGNKHAGRQEEQIEKQTDRQTDNKVNSRQTD
jgi:hypothetical protein